MTLATWVTLSRIVFLPLFLLTLLNGGLRLALLLFLFLVFTDWLDGWMARTWKQKTNLGAFLDPLADKFLVLGALVAMIELGVVDAWPVILLLLRELFVTGLRGMSSEREGFLPAQLSGKLKVVVEYLAIFFLLVGWSGGHLLLWLSVLLAYASVPSYLGKRS